MDTHQSQPQGHGKMNFRCADVGPKTCDWQVSGNSEEEIMPKIEQHGREKHNLTMDGETKNRVRSAIHRKAA
jgi:predicted small metal-binding protein